MSYAIDIILLAIAIFTVIKCYRDGFAISILRSARLFIAILGAWIFARVLGWGILGFLALLIAFLIAVELLMKLFKLVTKIPGIRGFDKLMGVVLGIACAFLVISIISWVFKGAASVYDDIANTSRGADLYLSSRVFKFMEGISFKLK